MAEHPTSTGRPEALTTRPLMPLTTRVGVLLPPAVTWSFSLVVVACGLWLALEYSALFLLPFALATTFTIFAAAGLTAMAHKRIVDGLSPKEIAHAMWSRPGIYVLVGLEFLTVVTTIAVGVALIGLEAMWLPMAVALGICVALGAVIGWYGLVWVPRVRKDLANLLVDESVR